MNSRSMLRRLNRLFPPPDPGRLALEAALKFFQFATYDEHEVVAEVYGRMEEMGWSFEELAQKDPQRLGDSLQCGK